MSALKGKKIILAVCGGIAAYKSCFLVRELIKAGAEVKVVMTPSACEFVTPLTFSTLSQNEVIVNIFPENKRSNLKLGTWHIELGLWADIMIIAPATVNTIGKIAHGFADNAVTTLVMSLRCPLVIAPAADVDMFEDEINQSNIVLLKSMGYFFIEPGFGDLASGLKGKGRLAEVEIIVEQTENILKNSFKDLKGKNILITSGPTLEPIDPVRFISNHSSGKMGQAIALAAFHRGANVTVISGPSNLVFPKSINLIRIKTADEMYEAVKIHFKNNEIFISAAAVSDFKPKKYSENKIKKTTPSINLELVKSKDILFEISKTKKKNQKIIGFALETNNDIQNAITKLESKNLDLIVLNNPLKKGSGFETDTNQVTIIDSKKNISKLKLMHKYEVAHKIFDFILKK